MPRGGVCSQRCSPRSRLPVTGKIVRGLILLAPLCLVSCQGGRAFDSTARTIRLREAPVPVPCHRGDRADECVVLLKQDWEALVIDYKGKCLQLGGAPAACQTEPPP